MTWGEMKRWAEANRVKDHYDVVCKASAGNPDESVQLDDLAISFRLRRGQVTPKGAYPAMVIEAVGATWVYTVTTDRHA